MDKQIFMLCLVIFALIFSKCNTKNGRDHLTFQVEPTDTLPLVFPDNKSDIIDKQLRYEAALKFAEQQLPSTMTEWEDYSTKLGLIS